MLTSLPLDLDRLLAALSLISLLLYLTPAILRRRVAPRWRRGLQIAAIATLAAGFGIALTATAVWFTG